MLPFTLKGAFFHFLLHFFTIYEAARRNLHTPDVAACSRLQRVRQQVADACQSAVDRLLVSVS